jgi:hypothetical protein
MHRTFFVFGEVFDMIKLISVTMCWTGLVLWGFNIFLFLTFSPLPLHVIYIPFNIEAFYLIHGWILFIIFAAIDVVNFIFKYVRRWILVLKFIVHVLMYLIYCLASLSLHA